MFPSLPQPPKKIVGMPFPEWWPILASLHKNPLNWMVILSPLRTPTYTPDDPNIAPLGWTLMYEGDSRQAFHAASAVMVEVDDGDETQETSLQFDGEDAVEESEQARGRN